jgi:hypothetical protein
LVSILHTNSLILGEPQYNKENKALVGCIQEISLFKALVDVNNAFNNSKLSYKTASTSTISIKLDCSVSLVEDDDNGCFFTSQFGIEFKENKDCKELEEILLF